MRHHASLRFLRYVLTLFAQGRVIHALAVFALLVGVMAFSPAYAEEYTVENVTVTASGDDAMQARSEAMNKAEREAFISILQQMAPEAIAGAEQIPAEQISAAVSGFLVNNEEIGPKSYKGSLNISFDPVQLNTLIGRASTLASQPVPTATAGGTPAPDIATGNASATATVGNPATTGASAPSTPSASMNLPSSSGGAMPNPAAQISGPGRKLTVLVPVANLPDWLAIRNAMVRSPAVRGLNVTAISFTQVDAVLTYTGNGQELERGLIGKGFRIYKQPSYWIVSR
jgi:hypothetical protein